MPEELLAFQDELTCPPVLPPLAVDPDGTQRYRIELRAGQRRIHRQIGPPTPFWGYEGLYPGPTIEIDRTRKAIVEFVNALPAPMGDPRSQWPFAIPGEGGTPGPVCVPPRPWTVVHLHGSPSSADSDGWTDNAYFPGGSAVHHYPVQESAALLWYHDHANMITRLNVYAGLAGLYLVRDPAVETAMGLPVGAPFEIPLLLQSRDLEVDADDRYTGRFQYQPLSSNSTFRGQFVLTNGTLWPFVKVQARRYRLRILNGANARFFRLTLRRPDGAFGTRDFCQVGVDGGFLPHPVQRPRTTTFDGVEEVLTLAPAERADVLLDLSGYAPGDQLTLVDFNPATETASDILRFDVQAGAAPAIPVLRAAPTRSARLPGAHAPFPARRRPIGLFRSARHPTPGGEPMQTINGRMFHDAVEEKVELDTEEVWEFLNVTSETHPMHLHLVNFQVVDRQPVEITDPDPEYLDTKFEGAFRRWLAIPQADRPPLPEGLRFAGEPLSADENEVSPKDTVRATRMAVTRIWVRFRLRAGMYMYHCHILEHEDMEMMRPLLVAPQGMLHQAEVPGGHHHGHG